MFAALRPAMPPKTNNVCNNPAYFEDGAAAVEFHREGPTYSMTFTVPNSSSMFNPPVHVHPFQDEAFEVRSGEAVFFMPRNANKAMRQVQASADAADAKVKEVVVPMGEYHNFKNASASEPLVLDVAFTTPDFDCEEKFFRNFFGYLDDCRKAQMAPSIFQLMRFLHEMDTPLGVPVPGPTWLAVAVSRGVCFVAGKVVGEWLLGYKSSYPEYYSPKGSKM